MSAVRLLAGLLTRRERWHAAGLAVLAVVGAFAEALGIGAVFPLLSLLTQREAMLEEPAVRALFDWSGARSHAEFVLLGTAALMLLFVLKNLYLSATYYAQSRFVCNAEARMGTDLLAAYLYAPYVERVEHNSADRILIITGEVSRVTAGYLLPLVNLVAEGLVIIALVTLLLVVQPQSALLALVLIAVVGAAVQLGFRRKLNAQRHVRVAASSAMFRAVGEGLGALKETKVLGQEPHFVRRFFDSSRRYAGATVAFMTINLLPRLITETAAVAALSGCVALSVLWRQPLETVVPVLIVFGLAAVRIMPSATRILGAANNLRYYAPSVREVSMHVAVARNLPREAPVSPNAPAEEIDSIELRSVFYTYAGAVTPALHDVTLRVQRGEIVAITGPSGSGKSTLADVMLGLISPMGGYVLVNGRQVGDLRSALGAFAGLVPQNFFILDDSVRRNVAFGVPSAAVADAQVWRALELASLADRVRRDPLGLDMPAGENGALLSGGERQRLSIARALYHDPALLVFDEATSALDAETEAQIVSTIVALSKTKAVLVIAHRPALLESAGRVFILENGNLRSAARPSREAVSKGGQRA